ncbi:MAG: class I tRNA ligase family protein, partial [Gemmatimonadota bacterium]
EPHSYPHCWRCSSPLIYLARESWYARTTALKDRMMAENRGIGWRPPEVGAGRFGEWLEGNVDWALSRDRFWGTPLPAWICDREAEHVEFIGSFAELADRAGELPVPTDAAETSDEAGERTAGGAADAADPRVPPGFDPHKPWIDEVSWPCAECGGTMRRTPEVIDVWFDSGSMPYAQWHYPFENEDEWRRHFPADFICEGVDQTRGWFYSLLAISTMLDDGPAYRNVIVNDLVLDKDGQKMSKSRGNVVDPWEAIDRFGADAIRWYFLTGSYPWIPKRFDPEALAEAARRTFDTLANSYRFFALYANLEAWAPSDTDPEPSDRHVLDRWILSRLHGLVAEARDSLEAYDLTRAARAIGDFIVDDLSNWYVRRSRDRFWGGGDGATARDAFRTLHDVLLAVSRLLGPLTPFQSDWLHRALTGGESVHLARFPDPEPSLRDEALEDAMESGRVLARLGRSARESVRIRVRQPLRTLYAVMPSRRAVSEAVLAVVRDELNVKEIRFLDDAEELLTLRAEPDFAAIGPRFGPKTNAVADAIRALPEDRLRAYDGGPLAIEVEGEGIELAGDEFELREEPRGELAVEMAEGVTVALDPTIDDALAREGIARELVNRIQRLRRDAGLEVADRIRLAITGPREVLLAAREHEAYIAAETLAREVEIVEDAAVADALGHARSVEIDGAEAHIGLAAL